MYVRVSRHRHPQHRELHEGRPSNCCASFACRRRIQSAMPEPQCPRGARGNDAGNFARRKGVHAGHSCLRSRPLEAEDRSKRQRLTPRIHWFVCSLVRSFASHSVARTERDERQNCSPGPNPGTATAPSSPQPPPPPAAPHAFLRSRPPGSRRL